MMGKGFEIKMASWVLIVSFCLTFSPHFAYGEGPSRKFLGENSEDVLLNAEETYSNQETLENSTIRQVVPDSPRRKLVVGKRGDGFWSVKGAKYYDANGNEVMFAGVQWSGLEVTGAPHGLWTRNYADMIAQIAGLGFNMLRLAFAGEALEPSRYPQNINYGINPELVGLNCLGVMDKVIEACGWNNMKVILDYHRVNLTDIPEYGLWFSDSHPESVWLDNWAMLAERYVNNPIVIGADLFNEIHNNTRFPDYPIWAPEEYGGIYNFRSAVKRVSDRIQTVNPNIIIFVEGMWWNSWWGGNLKELTKYKPIPLMVPNKLAYSAHDYGPNVFDQPWYRNKKFPENLEGYWRRRWGYVVERNIAPVWIGEWGSALDCTLISDKTPRELIWAYRFRDYIYKLQLSHTYFNWGPDSRDTGGILKDDWWSVWDKKMDLIRPVLHPDFGPSPGQ